MLQECGIRPSLQRVLILDYLKSVHSHPSVDSIYQALLPGNPGLSRTTVYNTLELFAEKGLALSLDFGEGFLRYDGEAKVVKDDALLDKVREIMPDIMGLYDQNGWEMGLFCLDGGHAEIRGLFDVIEEFDV